MICRVCAERAGGAPPNPKLRIPVLGIKRPNASKPTKLDPEPEPSTLRGWIVGMKEEVANAFSHVQYAMQMA